MKEKNGNGKHEGVSINMVFQDNGLLPMLFGEQDSHLARLEKKFNISASSRGNMLALSGEKSSVEASKAVLESLYADLKKGGEIGLSQVDAAIRMLATGGGDENGTLFDTQDIVIKTMKKVIKPYSPHQANYIQMLGANEMVFALGPAGTGKTYLAVAMAVAMFNAHRVEKIILSRPAVEAGEKLGFLPGDLKEKIDPYLRPLYDALFDMMPAEKLERHMETGEIEVAPLAFMRGRTFANAFVILDEAQNTTPTQMKMFLTRMGEGSRLVITGDLSQTDLPKDVKSGLGDAIRKIEGIDGIGVVRFTDGDVVRHPLAAKIIQAYDEWDRKENAEFLAELMIASSITIQLHHPRWKTRLKPYCKTVRIACEAALAGKKAEITVVLAGDDFIQTLNHTYRGKNKSTNILSFPNEDHLGDLVLALETIEREAQEQGKTFKDHTTHLLVHGTLHLLGRDHEKKRDAAEMEALEIKILKKLGVANPYL